MPDERQRCGLAEIVIRRFVPTGRSLFAINASGYLASAEGPVNGSPASSVRIFNQPKPGTPIQECTETRHDLLNA